MTDFELSEIEEAIEDAMEHANIQARTAGKLLGVIDEVRKLKGQVKSLLLREMERKSVVESK